jgi:anti-sigma factor ChrR (cupin superfamily)
MTHELKELAAGYALGALDDLEARMFEEHLGSGCGICTEELTGYRRTVGALALVAEPMEPPAHLRDDLRLRLAPAVFRSIRANQGEWSELMPGITIKQLHVDDRTGIATSLVRMRAGASLPRHRHDGIEQVFVLEGDCNINDERLGPGDFHFAEPGSIHDSTYTTTGTLFLLVADVNYQFCGTNKNARRGRG